jgi:hypothetical protein
VAWVRGIDVSHWQGLVRPAWCEYAWIKASQGRSMRDSAMPRHHANLSGIARGPYHYYDFARTPAENADNFIRATAGRTWELPHVLDAEHGGAGSRGRTADALLDFLARVELATNRTPVVYTYASWWNATVEARSAFTRYPLWIARYPNAYKDGNPPPTTSSTGAAQPWRTWAVWQYSTAGNLDRNVCTREALNALLGGHTIDRVNPPASQGALTMADAASLELLLNRLIASNTRIEAELRLVKGEAAAAGLRIMALQEEFDRLQADLAKNPAA